MRAAGLALDEISLRLSLPRTTVYYWIKDLPIERTIKQSEAQKRGSAAGKAKAALKRELVYREAFEQAPLLLKDPHLRDFVVLYMAEGYRRNRNCVALANSNPQILKLADRFIYKFAVNRVFYTLQYHADQSPDELIDYWSSCLGKDKNKFVLQRKSNSGQLKGRNWRSQFGVLTVRSDDTALRAKIQAWMDFLMKDWQTVGP